MGRTTERLTRGSDGRARPRDGEPLGSGPVVLLGMPDRDLLLGAVLRGRYRILERIGEGGMGVVYRAEDTRERTPLAIKLLQPELARTEEMAQRFEREAESIGRLSHPHIVKVSDFGKLDSGALYLVMELLDGVSLASLLEAQGRVPIDRAVGIMCQLLSGLDHAHAHGVIHRDLKPDNVVLLPRKAALGEGDFVKILDFSIAKLRDGATDSQLIRLTRAGIVLGTPSYMSPEQASGSDVDPRSDLYSSGVLLFEMITGRKPFSADRPMDVLAMHQTMAPPTPSSVAPEADIPWELEAIVLRTLEKDRDRRYPSASAMIQALDRFRAKRRAERRARLRRTGVVAAIALCLLAFAVLLGVRIARHRPVAPATASGNSVSQVGVATNDSLARYRRQLTEGATCAERREALIRLRGMGDRRALTLLRRARNPKVFPKLHGCVSKDQIDEAIRAIEGK